MIVTYLTLALLLVLMEIYLLPGLGFAPQPGAIHPQLKLRRALSGRLLATLCYIPLLIDLRNPRIIPVILLCCLLVSPILIRGLRPTPSGSREFGFLVYVFAIPAFVTALVQPPASVQSVFAGLVPRASSSFPSLTLSKALALSLAYTLAIRPGTTLVRAMLAWLPKDQFPVLLPGLAGSVRAKSAAGSEEPCDNGLIAAGKLIGNLERVTGRDRDGRPGLASGEAGAGSGDGYRDSTPCATAFVLPHQANQLAAACSGRTRRGVARIPSCRDFTNPREPVSGTDRG